MTTKPRAPRRPRTSIAIRAVESRIVSVRGIRVMIDSDLAELYGVPTRTLNQAVRRNRTRFPRDFTFTIPARDLVNLRSQIVISSLHGGRRYARRAFTEQGVAMLSSVLKSPRAVAVNVAIMRAFVRLRELALTHADLTRKLADLEKKYDGEFSVVFHAIRELTSAAPKPEPPRPRVGFTLPSAALPLRARAHH